MSSDPYRFSWSRPLVSDDCNVLYTVNGTSCGQCETMTSDTTITCSNGASEPGGMCTFAVGAIVCGELSRFAELIIPHTTPTTSKYGMHTFIVDYVCRKILPRLDTVVVKHLRVGICPQSVCVLLVTF